ncbi:hypothetical protein ACH61_01914 [Rathayibacter tanaceti]|uniref:Uncharacterized protein n=1 Tax=Rathayibacter tanaceti TaxID=1671680 RepID=A0A166HPS5_9MICO|nr:hypothetical protein ACH61_01914 [Rathayibacter tanaceti]
MSCAPPGKTPEAPEPATGPVPRASDGALRTRASKAEPSEPSFAMVDPEGFRSNV